MELYTDMYRCIKWSWVVIFLCVGINSFTARATNSETIVPIIDFILNCDGCDVTVPVPSFPRRRDFGPNGMFSAESGNLISRTEGNSQLTFEYDFLDRLTEISAVNTSDSTANLSISFIYVSLSTDRLSRIELTSFSDIGTELNSEISFIYNSINQLSDLTSATFEGATRAGADEQIFTISVNYEPVYEDGLLRTIRKELFNSLPFPLGGDGASTISISYDNNTVIEVVDLDELGGGRSIGRRINRSPLQQEVVRQLVTSDDVFLLNNTDIANYETVACNDSNRLVEDNILLFNLFLIPSVNLL